MNKISTYTLPNGLKIVVQEDHRAPVVVSQIWYKVGSSYEPKGITGISHLLEHMMFRGTKNYGPGELNTIVADNGGEINAFTSSDYTGYYEILAADKLPIAFELEADRMHGLLLNKKSFNHELQVVIEEWRSRLQDDPQSRTYQRFLAAAHVTSPYHHMTIGWYSDLQHLTVKDIRSWYKSWYGPNNAVLVVVGDVDPEKVYQLANKYFSHIAPIKLPQLKPEQEIEPLGERSVTVKLPAQVPWLIMGYNVPSLTTAKSKQEAYALKVAAAILSAGDSARLSTDLIRGQQLAVDVTAYYSLYSRLDDLFVLEGTPAPKHSVAELKTALLQQITKLQTTLVSAKELERIKTKLIASKTYAADSFSRKANDIGRLETVGLSWQDGQNYTTNIAAVTAKQVREVAKKYLQPERLTVAMLDPQKIGSKSAHK